MQNIEKKKNQYFKSFLFQCVESTESLPLLYCIIVFWNLIGDVLIVIEYIIVGFSYIDIGTEAFFYFQPIIIGLVLLSAFLSYFINIFKTIFIYLMVFLEMSSVIFIRNFYICLAPNYPAIYTVPVKIVEFVLFFIFILLIVFVKNQIYYPFQNVTHLFSMRQENISVFLLFFRIIIYFVLYSDFISDQGEKSKVIIWMTLLFFCKSWDSGYLNSTSKNIWDIYYSSISWVYFMLFISTHANLLLDNPNMKSGTEQLTFEETYVYLLSYTFPFVIVLPLLTLKSEGNWQEIFTLYDHKFDRVYEKETIYVLCDQIRCFIENLKKSEFLHKDPDFKILWKILYEHNERCTFYSCPLQELNEFNEEGNDQYFEHRKFTKSIKCVIEFVKEIFAKLKQNYSDVLEYELQVAHFYLMAMKNKQPGMVLFNAYNIQRNKKKEVSQSSYDNENQGQNKEPNKKKDSNNKKQVSKSSKMISWGDEYAILYLKKKIDKIFVGEQQQAGTNTDNEVTEFRQKIEISVTMLAEFWSMLADPKCNLKKMYDLANFLFPLKISLEEDWEKIKLLKNIEIYGIYAKYLIRMFNDKETGLKILEEAKKIDQELRSKEEIVLDDKGGPLLEENGIIFMEFDGKNSGVMFQANINAQKIFGYDKSELIGRKVNDLMPEIYAAQHDRILENYQQTNQSTMMNKQRNVWGKSKDGLLFPFIILIKPILSLYSQVSSSEVYANIKREVYLKEIIGIVIDNDGVIYEYSSSAIRVFPELKKHYEIVNKKNHLSYSDKNCSKAVIGNTVLKIGDIIPNFQEIKQKALTENEQCQVKIESCFKATRNNQNKIMEKSVYNLHVSEVTIKISGKIGYIIKMMKIGTSQYQFIEVGDQTLKLKNLVQNKDFFNLRRYETFSNTMKSKSVIDGDEEERKFIFSYDMSNKNKISTSTQHVENFKTGNLSKSKKSNKDEKIRRISVDKQYCQENQQQKLNMVYVGGFTQSMSILQAIKYQTVSAFRAQLKVSEQEHQENKIDYGIGIKPKRLQDKMVRQMREQQVQLQLKKSCDQQQQRQQGSLHAFNQIKPSQLNQITSKSSKNKLILYLRILTIILLICCSVMSIVQYNLMGDESKNVNDQMGKIKELAQIRTQILNLNFYVNFLVKFKENGSINMDKLHQSINQLNQYLNNFKFVGNTILKYSDGSSDNYYLGFALSKLISEANSLSLNTKTSLLPADESSNFFVRYNTINGLSLSLYSEEKFLIDSISNIRVNVQKMCIAFVAAMLSVCFTLILVNNILIRLVMKRKTEILEIFFEIPRASCSRIQKQCELFILQLSASNQQDQMEYSCNDEQFQVNKSSKNAQKKRTSVGEQNTSLIFSMVSIIFLIFLMSFPLFMMTKNKLEQTGRQELTSSSTLFYNLEFKLFEMATFIESYKCDPTIPIQNISPPVQKITSRKLQLQKRSQQLISNLYNIQKLFSTDNNKALIKLYYQNLCGDACKSSSTPEEVNGLNSVVARYVQILKDTYEGVFGAAVPVGAGEFANFRQYMLSIKIYWRKLTLLVNKAGWEFVKGEDFINLLVLAAICTLNLLVILIGWMWYYGGLQQKIMATEYILAFIPIDQINQNGKIANYIRQQILQKK